MDNNQFIPYQIYETKGKPNFQTLFKRYLAKWPWFVLSFGLSLAAAYVYLLYQTPIYNVKASVLVKDEKRGISEQTLMKEMNSFTESKVVENEMEILKSFTLMDRVVRRLGLAIRYYQPTRTYTQEIYAESPIRLIVENPLPRLYSDKLALSFVDTRSVNLNGAVYPVNQRINTPYGQLRLFTPKPLSQAFEPIYVSVSPHKQTVEGYLSGLKIEPTAKLSTMLAISLQDAVPDKGEAVLNQLINEYRQESVHNKNEEARNAIKFIEDRLALISAELFKIENQVEAYKSAQTITDLSVQAQTFLSGVSQNDAQLSDVEIQLDALKDVERYVKNRSEQQVFAPGVLGLDKPVLTGLLAKVAELELKREEASKTVSTGHPLYQSLESQLSSVKASVNDNIQSMRQQLLSNRRQLVLNNQRMEQNMKTLPAKERTLLDITRQQSIKNELYTYLLQKHEETALSAASAVSTSRTVDAAHADSQPVKPIRMMVFALSALLSLLLPLGIITVRDVLNNHVVLRSDVEESTQVPILGEVAKGLPRSDNNLVFKPNIQSVIGEQIRTLRTNLQFLQRDSSANKVILFTSSISGEGKSFVSLNVGVGFALVGRTTLLLDLDMRRPKLHKSLYLENKLGLSNYLKGEIGIDELLRPIIGYENFYVITAGSLPQNPSELLNSPRLADLFSQLRERFDYVLVDSPPIGLVADAQLIAPFVDTTIFIVRHDYTPKSYIKLVEKLNNEQRFPRLHIVLNGIGKSEAYSYSYGYEDYRTLTKNSG